MLYCVNVQMVLNISKNCSDFFQDQAVQDMKGIMILWNTENLLTQQSITPQKTHLKNFQNVWLRK